MAQEFETKVLSTLVRIEERINCLPDHEKRIRFLERVAYSLMGAWALVTTWIGQHILGARK